LCGSAASARGGNFTLQATADNAIALRKHRKHILGGLWLAKEVSLRLGAAFAAEEPPDDGMAQLNRENEL
jgi:hypothetical protein